MGPYPKIFSETYSRPPVNNFLAGKSLCNRVICATSEHDNVRVNLAGSHCRRSLKNLQKHEFVLTVRDGREPESDRCQRRTGIESMVCAWGEPPLPFFSFVGFVDFCKSGRVLAGSLKLACTFK